MSTVAGLDLSLTATGLSMWWEDRFSTGLVESTGKKGASASSTAHRISGLIDEIESWLYGACRDYALYPLELAVIESPSFGSKGGSAHERGGLWWGVAGMLKRHGIAIATVAPTTLKVYGAGKGGASKAEMIAAAKGRHPDVSVPDDNVADAITLAEMGARWLGQPIDDVPLENHRAMQSAKWPSPEEMAASW